eukprot:3677200-Prymnesium_polylepis.2
METNCSRTRRAASGPVGPERLGEDAADASPFDLGLHHPTRREQLASAVAIPESPARRDVDCRNVVAARQVDQGVQQHSSAREASAICTRAVHLSRKRFEAWRGKQFEGAAKEALNRRDAAQQLRVALHHAVPPARRTEIDREGRVLDQGRMHTWRSERISPWLEWGAAGEAAKSTM